MDSPIRLQQRSDLKKHCICMFSGGRDSTIAAVRLHQQGYAQTLVTITSDHLTGIHAVQKRLVELKRILPPTTEWLSIRQPTELLTDTSFYEKTCLRCHHGYVVVGAAVALALHARNLAFGYAGYQNTWPEQTPLAVDRLSKLLDRHGVKLLLPAYSINSKEEIHRGLAEAGLSVHSLEQKCSQQVNNIELPPDALNRQIALWEQAIEASVGKVGLIHISKLDARKLGDFHD